MSSRDWSEPYLREVKERLAIAPMPELSPWEDFQAGRSSAFERFWYFALPTSQGSPGSSDHIHWSPQSQLVSGRAI